MSLRADRKMVPLRHSHEQGRLVDCIGFVRNCDLLRPARSNGLGVGAMDEKYRTENSLWDFVIDWVRLRDLILLARHLMRVIRERHRGFCVLRPTATEDLPVWPIAFAFRTRIRDQWRLATHPVEMARSCLCYWIVPFLGCLRCE